MSVQAVSGNSLPTSAPPRHRVHHLRVTGVVVALLTLVTGYAWSFLSVSELHVYGNARAGSGLSLDRDLAFVWICSGLFVAVAAHFAAGFLERRQEAR